MPLLLSLGLGLGAELKVGSSFGLLAMASVGPILSVLSTGLFLQWRQARTPAHSTYSVR